jgi:uncharacterized protein YkwD
MPAGHQRKPLAFYLAATMVLAGALQVASIPAVAAQRPDPQEEELLGRVNEERGKRGLAALQWNPDLARLARLHAADMQAHEHLSHLRAEDGAPYKDRLISSGLRARLAKENIGMGSSLSSIHLGLMRSPGHRAAILDPGLNEVGMGVTYDEAERLFWVVQDFASLMPAMDDAAVLAAVQQALAAAWQAAGASAPSEKTALSRTLAESLKTMVQRDEVSARSLPVPPPAWVFAYTTDDPGRLPEDVLAKAGQARTFGAAAGFHRTAGSPMGVFWVALALTDLPRER